MSSPDPFDASPSRIYVRLARGILLEVRSAGLRLVVSDTTTILHFVKLTPRTPEIAHTHTDRIASQFFKQGLEDFGLRA